MNNRSDVFDDDTNDWGAMSAQHSMRARPVTLADVAARGGVTAAAVSQALSGSGTLSDATRERLKSLAAEMGYVRNRHASSLRTGHTYSIGFVLPCEATAAAEQRWAAYFTRQLTALVSEAASSGFVVSVIPDNKPELVAPSRVDALYYIDPPADGPVIAEAIRINLPILTNGNIVQPHREVLIDSGQRESTRFALERLASAGAQRIGLLTEERGTPSDEIPEDTYLEWCAETGREAIVVHGDPGRAQLEASVTALVEAGVDGIYSYYEEGPQILEILGRRFPERAASIHLIAAAVDDASANIEHGIPTVLFHPATIPAASFSALTELINSPQLTSTVVRVPWEFVD